MPTYLGSVSSNELKVRYKEPFLTGGVNEKHSVVVPRGIYQGFKLADGVANYEITVDPDPDGNDHVAVYQSLTGYSMRVRRSGGAFTLDLTALANKTVVLAIYAEYAVNKDTTGEIRAYELSPVDEFTGAAEKDELIVLGGAVVPAAPGPITGSSVLAIFRTSAWENVAPGANAWAQFIENGGFETAQLGTATASSNAEPWPGWDTYSGLLESGGTQFSVVNSQARTGDHSLRVALSGNPGQQAALYYGGMMQVRPDQLLHASMWAMGTLVAPGPGVGGGLGLRFNFYTKSFGFAGNDFVFDDTVTGSFSWREIAEVITVPSTAAWAEVYVYYFDNNQSSTGDFFIDDVRVWAETGDPTDDSTAEDDAFQGSARVLSLDLAPSPPLGSLSGFLDRMVRLRSQGGSPVQDILMGCRDGASLFNLILRFGGLEVDRAIERLGLTLLSSAADGAIPRIQMPVFPVATTPYVLLWEADNSVSGAPYLRCYATEDAGISGAYDATLVFTVNAEWDGTQWVADVPAAASSRLDLEGAGLHSYERAAGGASPWADTAWSDPDGVLITAPGAAFNTNTIFEAGLPIGTAPSGVAKWQNVGDSLNPLDVGGLCTARYDLSMVPGGATIQDVRVWVAQGNASPFTAELRYVWFQPGGGLIGPISIGATAAPAAGGSHEIILTGGGMPLSTAKSVPGNMFAYYLYVLAPAVAHTSHLLQGALVRYTNDKVGVR